MGPTEVSLRAAKIISEFRPPLAAYQELYRHFHANPELSLQEKETAARISKELRKCDFKIHERIGGYGIVAVLENGPGKTVLLRADMDALPVEEK
jgi:metal-dependent amidase/aminoacylase/carboxypeptidase family protein